MTGAPDEDRFARAAPGASESAADGRLSAPVFDRNNPPILAALAPWLFGRRGPVLEIGCGTGQHGAALALAFPDLEWHVSDPLPAHRASAAAWAGALRLAQREPLALDAATDWASRDDVRALGPLSAVAAFNVIHIAPPAVTQGLIEGAARSLSPGGLLILYGPFLEQGLPVGQGNAAFDADLASRDPDWGLREVGWVRRLGAAAGLNFAALLAMPADNRILILRKA